MGGKVLLLIINTLWWIGGKTTPDEIFITFWIQKMWGKV